jgi:hypothetical protein
MKITDDIRSEWNKIMKQYPSFARAHIAQQAIMMEAVSLGDRMVVQRMSQLLDADVPLLFRGFWELQCQELAMPEDLMEANSLLTCLTDQNRDPARCFSTDREDWFDDPFATDRPIKGPR